MEQEDRVEFSVRENWRGQLILRVRHFDNFPHTGQWIDATGRFLPLFFKRILKTKPEGAR